MEALKDIEAQVSFHFPPKRYLLVFGFFLVEKGDVFVVIPYTFLPHYCHAAIRILHSLFHRILAYHHYLWNAIIFLISFVFIIIVQNKNCGFARDGTHGYG